MEHPLKPTIMEWIANHKAEMESTFSDLHAIAEISWKEYKTTTYLQRVLDKIGVANETISYHTGTVARWNGESSGPVIALRSDIDALWQHVDQEWRANHSCGHDAHMTMVLYAIRCLKEIGFVPAGKLIMLFQPAEEVGEGAQTMVQLGFLDEVDCILGIHVRPLKELPYGKASSAIYHGAAAFLEGKIHGRQSHASRPNDGINVIDSLAAIVGAVNAVKANPTLPTSCKVTKALIENASVNIIPDIATFAIDIRAQTNEAMDVLLEQVKHAVLAAGSANGAQVEVDIGARMVAAVPNAYMERVVGEAVVDILGETGLSQPPITPGGEDFHFYPLLKPSIQATMVGLGTGLVPGLHHPQMSFNLASLQIGAAILALSVIKLFETNAGNHQINYKN